MGLWIFAKGHRTQNWAVQSSVNHLCMREESKQVNCGIYWLIWALRFNCSKECVRDREVIWSAGATPGTDAEGSPFNVLARKIIIEKFPCVCGEIMHLILVARLNTTLHLGVKSAFQPVLEYNHRAQTWNCPWRSYCHLRTLQIRKLIGVCESRGNFITSMGSCVQLKCPHGFPVWFPVVCYWASATVC